jgi:hypothetical protein
MGTIRDLWVPQSAAGDVAHATARQHDDSVIREQREIADQVEDVVGRLEYFTKLAREIDDDLRIILAKPTTTVDGLKPGYYHAIRIRNGQGTYVQAYEDPETGAPRDLDEGILDMIKEGDLWNDRTQREIRRKREKAEAARLRHKDLEAQARAREFDERLKSRLNTSISVPKEIT